MRNLLPLLALFLTVGGCATVVNPVPDGYLGATATVFDSFVAQDKRKANVYYLESVNGTRIENAEGASRGASAGNGFSLTPQGASRQVPVELLSMHLIGAVQHGADFGALFNLGSNYRVEGDVRFQPKANQSYTVVGQLGENYSAVWLADASGERVSDRVEIKGKDFDPAVDGKAQRRVPVATVGDLSREEVFLRISPGMSVDTVVAKLGAPDVATVNESGFMSDKPSTVTYVYNELGTVVFLKPNLGIFRKDEAGPTVVLQSSPQIKASDNPGVVRSQIASASGPGLQQLAKNYYAQPAHSIAVLDLFADEIWQNRSVEGGYAVDAIAYLCRTLGKSQNSRYRRVLQEVAEMASSKNFDDTHLVVSITTCCRGASIPIISWVSALSAPKSEANYGRNDPLHGVTLKAVLALLVERYGWEALGEEIAINCFTNEPSINSSLKFTKKRLARQQVEALYVQTVRQSDGAYSNWQALD